MTNKEAKAKMVYDPVKGWHLPKVEPFRHPTRGGNNTTFKGTRREDKESPFYGDKK